MKLQEELKKVIINVATSNINVSDINDDTVLTRDLGFDSVQIISLIVEIEAQFNIEIEDEDLDIEKLTVFNNLYSTIAKKLKYV